MVFEVKRADQDDQCNRAGPKIHRAWVEAVAQFGGCERRTASRLWPHSDLLLIFRNIA
jgi:hypothetical protein